MAGEMVAAGEVVAMADSVKRVAQVMEAVVATGAKGAASLAALAAPVDMVGAETVVSGAAAAMAARRRGRSAAVPQRAK